MSSKQIMGKSHLNAINVINTFVLKSKFTCHQRIHNGEKPFKCDLCDETFLLKNKLTSYQKSEKTHIGEKPLKCEECDKRLVQKVDFVCQ